MIEEDDKEDQSDDVDELFAGVQTPLAIGEIINNRSLVNIPPYPAILSKTHYTICTAMPEKAGC